MAVEKPIPFSRRIKDRHRRWWKEKAPVEHKHVGGKLTGRHFAERLGCKVPVLYALAEEIDDLPAFSQLPDQFVVKPSIGWSAKNVFVVDGGIDLLRNIPCSREDILRALKEDPLASRPQVQVLVEELLQNWDGKPGIPLDYKFYTFADEIAFIHVIERNSSSDLRSNRHWYLTDRWELIDRRIVTSQLPELSPLPMPNCFEELLGIVKVMGRELGMFMRIDMYATRRGAVFGEFTPQPHGGSGFTPWADEWLGSLWQGPEGRG